jgi:hypothetical protein
LQAIAKAGWWVVPNAMGNDIRLDGDGVRSSERQARRKAWARKRHAATRVSCAAQAIHCRQVDKNSVDENSTAARTSFDQAINLEALEPDTVLARILVA